MKTLNIIDVSFLDYQAKLVVLFCNRLALEILENGSDIIK